MKTMNFEWASPMQASDLLIEKAVQKMEENTDISLVQEVRRQIESDEEDDSVKLLEAYKRATSEEKAAMDVTLIYLTGWSLATLIREMRIEEEEVAA